MPHGNDKAREASVIISDVEEEEEFFFATVRHRDKAGKAPRHLCSFYLNGALNGGARGRLHQDLCSRAALYSPSAVWCSPISPLRTGLKVSDTVVQRGSFSSFARAIVLLLGGGRVVVNVLV